MMAAEEIAVMVVVLTIILGVPLGLVAAAVRWARSHAKH
jgi:hypothetical protein